MRRLAPERIRVLQVRGGVALLRVDEVPAQRHTSTVQRGHGEHDRATKQTTKPTTHRYAREADAVADEEHRGVVACRNAHTRTPSHHTWNTLARHSTRTPQCTRARADEVVVAVLSEKLDGEPARVALRVSAAQLAADGAEPREHGRALADAVQELRLAELRDVMRDLEVPVGSRACSTVHGAPTREHRHA